MADEAVISEAPERPAMPEQSQTEPTNRGGFWSRIGGLFSKGERTRGGEDLANGDLVGMFDALSTALEKEGISSNQDVSLQNTHSFASRLLDSPAFGGLFPNVKAIKLGENRIIEKSNFQDVSDVEPEALTLDEMREVIEKERARLGPKAKALV